MKKAPARLTNDWGHQPHLAYLRMGAHPREPAREIQDPAVYQTRVGLKAPRAKRNSTNEESPSSSY